MGPMVSAGQRDSVQRYVDATTIAFQGRTPGGDGFWLPAMVTESKDVAEPVWREEVFGPLVAVMAFDDEDEAVALANDSDYGLSGSIYTQRPGPGPAGLARRPDRQPEREQPLERPLLDAVRRLQDVRPRPGARPGRAVCVHRGEERLHRALAGGRAVVATVSNRRRKELKWQDASRAGWPWSPAAARGSGWRRYAGSPRRARSSSSATSTTTAAPASSRSWAGATTRRTCTSTSPTRQQVDAAVQDGQGHLRLRRHRLQQRRHQPAGRRLDPRHRARRRGAACRRST